MQTSHISSAQQWFSVVCQTLWLTIQQRKWGFPSGSVVKNLLVNAGDTGGMGSIPGLERSPGGGNGNPLQYSCLGNPMDRGAWWAFGHGVTKDLDMT